MRTSTLLEAMLLLKRLTVAQIVMSEADAALPARGGKGDFPPVSERIMAYEPVQADRIIRDGEQVSLETYADGPPDGGAHEGMHHLDHGQLRMTASGTTWSFMEAPRSFRAFTWSTTGVSAHRR